MSNSHLLSRCSCIAPNPPPVLSRGAPRSLRSLCGRCSVPGHLSLPRPVSREFPPAGAALAWRPARESGSRPLLPAALAKAERAFLGAGAASCSGFAGKGGCSARGERAALKTSPTWLRVKRNGFFFLFFFFPLSLSHELICWRNEAQRRNNKIHVESN